MKFDQILVTGISFICRTMRASFCYSDLCNERILGVKHSVVYCPEANVIYFFFHVRSPTVACKHGYDSELNNE